MRRVLHELECIGWRPSFAGVQVAFATVLLAIGLVPVAAVAQPPEAAWGLLGIPLGVQGHAAVYDPLRQRLIAFGGNRSESFSNEVFFLSLLGPQRWQVLATSDVRPTPRTQCTAIYDSRRDRVIVYGGLGGNFDMFHGSFLSDVWALSLSGTQKWTLLATTGDPGVPLARDGHSAIYDPVRDRMVIFGGFTSDPVTRATHDLNDVWELPLNVSGAAAAHWHQIIPAGTPPPTRAWASTVYDPYHDRMLVFGGALESARGASNDVWSLTFSGTVAWTTLAPAGTPPAPRCRAAAAIDAMNRRLLIFGGDQDDSPVRTFADAWSLSLDGGSEWTPLAPTGVAPSTRTLSSWAYDPPRQRMVLFGGTPFSSTFASFDDVWALALNPSPRWDLLKPPTTQPSRGFVDHTSTLDPVRKRMVVLGGSSGGFEPVLHDVLLLPLAGEESWSRVRSAGPAPLARDGQSAIYDPVRDRIVVFGGRYAAYSDTNDTWVLSLAGTPTWSPLTPAGVPPLSRAQHSAIYDPIGDRMIVFGGEHLGVKLDDAWSLSLAAGGVWSALTPAGLPPPPVSSHAAVFDAARGRMLVVGGELLTNSGPSGAGRNSGVTWALSLNGAPAWSRVSSLDPAFAHSVAILDPLGDRLLVFGGARLTRTGGISGTVESLVNEVWELPLTAGGDWSAISTTSIMGAPPSGRKSHTAIYDPDRDRLLIYGGEERDFFYFDPVVDQQVLGDVWSLQLIRTLAAPPRDPLTSVSLAPVYPNPARGAAVTIKFALPAAGRATLRVYDVAGRVVRTLVDGKLAAGARTTTWDLRASDGEAVSAGLYFYELDVAGSRRSRRIAIVR